MSNKRRVQRALDARDKERAEAREAALVHQDPAEELVTCLDILAQGADGLTVEDNDQNPEFSTALWQTVELTLLLLAEHGNALAMLAQHQQLLMALDKASQEAAQKQRSGLVLPGDERFAV